MVTLHLQVQDTMSIETAAVAMETEFPDAPDDILNESSPHELERKVRGHIIFYLYYSIVYICGGNVLFLAVLENKSLSKLNIPAIYSVIIMYYVL